MSSRTLLARSVVSTALAFGLAGCGAAGPMEDGDLGSAESAIFGGEVDQGHGAVVALLSDEASCTATVIAVSGDQGFALTAAHCLKYPPKWVAFGVDYADPSAVFLPVTDAVAHPAYGNLLHDFAMVRFSGAGPWTPAIPVMTPADDDLAVGVDLEFVGYGLTENGPTTMRRHVTGTIDEMDSTTVTYGQAIGGPCQGDSGGPAFRFVGGVEMLAAVTSYGDQACTQYGVSGRTSAAWESFIAPYLGIPTGEQPPPPPATCGSCVEQSLAPTGACGGAMQACASDPTCASLATCVDGCADHACVDQCAGAHAAAVATYDAVLSCLCTTACSSACAGECGTPETHGSSGDPSGGTTGGDEDDDDDDDGDRAREQGGCSMGRGRSPSSAWIVALAALAAVSLRRRR